MRRILCAVVIVLLAAACDSGTHRSADSSGPTSSPKPAYTPRFTTIPCSDPRVSGAHRVPKGTRHVDCGVLTVPEDRSNPSGRSVVLPVAIVRSTSPHKRPDPIVYFEGGPGGNGLSSIASFRSAHLVTDRDMIFFDQRGTGKAKPSLECPEVDAATYKNLDTTDPVAVEDARSVAAYGACRNRLAKIADLNHYNTPTTAEDVADLRRALGIRQWNIFGISYGTTVALEVLRSQPQGVRSAVIDSVFPPYVNDGPQDTLDAVLRVFRTLYNGCRKDRGVQRQVPDARGRCRRRCPARSMRIRTTCSTPTRWARRGSPISPGPTSSSAAWNAMYDSSLIPLLPSYVEQLKQGNYAVLKLVGSRLLPNLTGIADADNVSVECADRQQRSQHANVAVPSGCECSLRAAARSRRSSPTSARVGM